MIHYSYLHTGWPIQSGICIEFYPSVSSACKFTSIYAIGKRRVINSNLQVFFRLVSLISSTVGVYHFFFFFLLMVNFVRPRSLLLNLGDSHQVVQCPKHGCLSENFCLNIVWFLFDLRLTLILQNYFIFTHLELCFYYITFQPF